jgi:hypothetical protein
MTPALRILLLVLWVVAALLLVHLAARAHQAPSGWQYDPECCSGRDCAEVAPPTVTPDGLVFFVVPGGHPAATRAGRPLTVTVAHDDRRIRASGDDHWHLCLTLDGRAHVLCVYRPAMGM